MVLRLWLSQLSKDRPIDKMVLFIRGTLYNLVELRKLILVVNKKLVYAFGGKIARIWCRLFWQGL